MFNDTKTHEMREEKACHGSGNADFGKTGEDGEKGISVLRIAAQMARRRKIYRYLFGIAVCAGILAGLAMMELVRLTKGGEGDYARAVIAFQYPGIEDGLDPNGAVFDINKLKSPSVIEAALDSLDLDGVNVEEIRKNIVIEGIVPKDALERITVINEMAVGNVSNYEKILDVSYFPSQYAVSLYQAGQLSADDTRELLDAILESYRMYFLHTYANTAVFAMAGEMGTYQEYDYLVAIDVARAQIELMTDYVKEKYDQAPDFRSVNTGLSFGDILSSLRNIKNIDLANTASFIESNTLAKDGQSQMDYYNYKIKDYERELSQIQRQLEAVQGAIVNYVKDPVLVVSGEGSTQIRQSSEFYDALVEEELDLSRQMAEVNTSLSKAYEILHIIEGRTGDDTGEKYAEADEMLTHLAETLSRWAELTEQTTEEYYTTVLYMDGVKVAVPAQYQETAQEGIGQAGMRILLSIAVCVAVVFVLWCTDGLRLELISMHKRESGEGLSHE